LFNAKKFFFSFLLLASAEKYCVCASLPMMQITNALQMNNSKTHYFATCKAKAAHQTYHKTYIISIHQLSFGRCGNWWLETFKEQFITICVTM